MIYTIKTFNVDVKSAECPGPRTWINLRTVLRFNVFHKTRSDDSIVYTFIPIIRYLYFNNYGIVAPSGDTKPLPDPILHISEVFA